MDLGTITDFIGITSYRSKAKVLSTKTPYPNNNGKVDIEKAKESLGEKKILFKWSAESRIIKPMSEKANKRATALLIAVFILLLLMQQFVLMIAVLCMAFLRYVLLKTPPAIVQYEISSHGVMFDESFYYWWELRHFFFKDDNGANILCIDTIEPLPGRLFIQLKDNPTEPVKNEILNYIPYLQQEPKTWADKAFYKLSSKINLDK